MYPLFTCNLQFPSIVAEEGNSDNRIYMGKKNADLCTTEKLPEEIKVLFQKTK